MAPTICTDKKTRRNSIRDLRLQRRNANFFNINNTNNNNSTASNIQHNYVSKNHMNSRMSRRLQIAAHQQRQQQHEQKQQLSDNLVTSTTHDSNQTDCNANMSSSRASTPISLSSLSSSPTYQYSDDSMDENGPPLQQEQQQQQQQQSLLELHRKHSIMQNIYKSNNNCSSAMNFYNKVFSCNNNNSLACSNNHNYVQKAQQHYDNKNSKNFINLREIQNPEGLLAIAIKTIKLVKRNQMLQRRLAQLQVETSEFIQSVLANPENRHFREKIQQKDQQQQVDKVA